jgi:hypothetical protein
MIAYFSFNAVTRSAMEIAIFFNHLLRCISTLASHTLGYQPLSANGHLACNGGFGMVHKSRTLN